MIVQGSPEWFAERAGRITASAFSDAMAFTVGEGEYKSGPRKGQAKEARPLKARLDMIRRIACERLTGKTRDPIKARALDWGHDVEPLARAMYQARTGLIVQTCGLVVHPEHPFIGASPDFRFLAIGGGEIKCPINPEVHMETLEEGMPDEHVAQVQGGLWVTGAQWWDFCSFHGDFPPRWQLYVKRIERDEAFIARLRDCCLSAEVEIAARVAKFQIADAA